MKELMILLTLIVTPLALVVYLGVQDYKRYKMLCEEHNGVAHLIDTGFWTDEKGCIIDGEFKHITSSGILFTKGI